MQAVELAPEAPQVLALVSPPMEEEAVEVGAPGLVGARTRRAESRAGATAPQAEAPGRRMPAAASR